jgi:hypothetical protein
VLGFKFLFIEKQTLGLGKALVEKVKWGVGRILGGGYITLSIVLLESNNIVVRHARISMKKVPRDL